MRKINHSNLARHLLTGEPVRRAVVVHSSRQLAGVCSVADLARLEEIDPSEPEPDDQDDDQAQRSAADRGGGYGGSAKITGYIRDFLIRACGMEPWETDDGAADFFDQLSEPLQDACRAHAAAREAEDEETEDEPDGNGQAARAAGDLTRDWVTRSAGRVFCANGSTVKLTESTRAFLAAVTGLDPNASDEEAANHYARLRPQVQRACRAYAESDRDPREAQRAALGILTSQDELDELAELAAAFKAWCEGLWQADDAASHAAHADAITDAQSAEEAMQEAEREREEEHRDYLRRLDEAADSIAAGMGR
jgi:hypothetical protein